MASWYEKLVLPKLLDLACSQPPMTRLRDAYVSQAEGEVLELGIGSGLNLTHYDSKKVRSVTGVDPAASITEIAAERASKLDLPVDVLGISGEALDADDKSFDTIVCTWTLCTIPNPYRAVEEMRRVLKPGGRVIFVEHGKADDAPVARWQRRVEPVWKSIAGGCHLTRRADDLLRDGGFDLSQFSSGYEKGPKIASFMMHGFATPR